VNHDQPPAPVEAWRPFFVAWAVTGPVVLGLWWAALRGDLPPVAPAQHGLWMVWGVYGSAVLGFLWTAFPRQNQAPPPSSAWVWSLLTLHVAFLLFGVGAWLGPTGWTAGLSVVAGVAGVAVWGSSLVRVCAIARSALRRSFDGTTAGIPVSLALGLVGLVLTLAGEREGRALGLFGFLLPLALLLLDRVLPFFTLRALGDARASRRPHFWWPLLLLGVVRVALDERGAWCSLFLAAWVLRQWTGWAPWAARRVPLLAVLHVGLGWSLLGLSLDGASMLWPGLQGAARHVLLVGALGSLLWGLSVRVARGHGGAALRLGWDGAVMFALVQVAAVSRGLGPALGFGSQVVWGLASVCLIAAWLLWLARLGPLAWGRSTA